MRHVWTWRGKFFGQIDDQDLWTYGGKHVGKLRGDEIFGCDGRYIGEVMNDDRLITNIAKCSSSADAFTPHARRAGITPYTNYFGYFMHPGHQDFPGPDEF